MPSNKDKRYKSKYIPSIVNIEFGVFIVVRRMRSVNDICGKIKHRISISNMSVTWYNTSVIIYSQLVRSEKLSGGARKCTYEWKMDQMLGGSIGESRITDKGNISKI